MTKCDCAPFHVNGPTDAQPSGENLEPFRGQTAIARQRGFEQTGCYRFRPNNDTRHALCLRGAWRLGAGAGIFLSLLSRHRDCAFVLAIALAPLTAQVTASARPHVRCRTITPCWPAWFLVNFAFTPLEIFLSVTPNNSDVGRGPHER